MSLTPNDLFVPYKLQVADSSLSRSYEVMAGLSTYRNEWRQRQFYHFGFLLLPILKWKQIFQCFLIKMLSESCDRPTIVLPENKHYSSF